MDKIHLFLNGERGIAVAEGLLQAGHGIAMAYVLTQITGSPEIVKRLAAIGLSTEETNDVNETGFVKRLTKSCPRLLIVSGFPQIFRKPLLSTAELGAINLHAGRLPMYRGGSPLNWQIINGETEAGISILKMGQNIDTGEILAEARFPIGSNDCISDLQERANKAFPDLVNDVVPQLENGTVKARPQDDDQAMYWHQRNDEDGLIDWNRMSAGEIDRLVRAVTRPYPGAFTHWRKQTVRIYAVEPSGQIIRGVPGRVCYVQGEGPYVVCADHALLLRDYVIESKPEEKLPSGAHLGTESSQDG
jgi:methionyl-tRNA formyltransferase